MPRAFQTTSCSLKNAVPPEAIAAARAAEAPKAVSWSAPGAFQGLQGSWERWGSLGFQVILPSISTFVYNAFFLFFCLSLVGFMFFSFPRT